MTGVGVALLSEGGREMVHGARVQFPEIAILTGRNNLDKSYHFSCAGRRICYIYVEKSG
jgi:hypothetical protein